MMLSREAYLTDLHMPTARYGVDTLVGRIECLARGTVDIRKRRGNGSSLARRLPVKHCNVNRVMHQALSNFTLQLQRRGRVATPQGVPQI